MHTVALSLPISTSSVDLPASCTSLQQGQEGAPQRRVPCGVSRDATVGSRPSLPPLRAAMLGTPYALHRHRASLQRPQLEVDFKAECQAGNTIHAHSSPLPPGDGDAGAANGNGHCATRQYLHVLQRCDGDACAELVRARSTWEHV